MDVEGRDPDIPLEERKGFMEVLMEEQEQQQAGKKGGGKGRDETDNVGFLLLNSLLATTDNK